MSMARKQSLPKKPLSTRPDHLRKFYGANLAEGVRTPAYDCSLKNELGVPDFALTRLKGGSMEMQRAPAYPEDRAMLICVALAPTPVDRWRARIAGQEVSVSHSIAFATTVIDLMKPMEMWAAGPFDYLHYYVSRDLLDRVAADNRIAPVDSFRMVFFERDLVVAQLTKTILSQVRKRSLSLSRSEGRAGAQTQSQLTWEPRTAPHCLRNRCAPSLAIDWMCLCS